MSEERATPETRRESLAAAFDKAETVEKAEMPEKAEAAPERGAPAVEADERPESDRERDERGRFKAKEGADADPGDEQPQKAELKREPRKYPSSWKPDYEPLYRKLESQDEFQAVLDEIERRENDFHKGLEGSKQQAQFAQAVQRAIQPYEATLRQMGLPPDQAIQRLFNFDHTLRYSHPQQRLQHFAQLAQEYGIDTSQLAEGVPQVDPQLAELRQTIAQQQAQLQQFTQQYQAQQMSHYNAQIDAFKKDHEFFEEVRQDMGALMAAGRASDMQDAYEKACWANPSVRTRLQAKAQAEAEHRRKQEAEAKTKAAKAAAVSVKGAPPSGAGSKPASAKSRREVIAEAANQ